ncbi:metal-sulfur cluster assembly factor [Desertivirga xinjiangensis]|uniref:metal-sulfur cluster assembly factor n=1 Tax=Desertivirga xinjiangensis TaxID=539206 RepID=UPI00210D256E|nr:metal-sulfur cluster assembly factor [Pedobacter xinjiangensis]
MEIFDITQSDSFFKLRVVESLRLVIDPELEINIIDLGLVYNVDVNEESKVITISMTLSSPACPMGGTIVGSVENCLTHHYPEYKTSVDLVWEPVWSFDRISKEGKRLLGM